MKNTNTINGYDEMKSLIKKMKEYNKTKNQPQSQLIKEDYNDSNNEKKEDNLLFGEKQQSLIREDDEELTDEEVQEEKEQFESSVSSPVEYGEFKIYGDNVEWSGKLIKENISWIYSLDDIESVYITSEQLHLTDSVIETLQKLKSYWTIWSEKWSKEISA